MEEQRPPTKKEKKRKKKSGWAWRGFGEQTIKGNGERQKKKKGGRSEVWCQPSLSHFDKVLPNSGISLPCLLGLGISEYDQLPMFLGGENLN
jgi:hypothetical protein